MRGCGGSATGADVLVVAEQRRAGARRAAAVYGERVRRSARATGTVSGRPRTHRKQRVRRAGAAAAAGHRASARLVLDAHAERLQLDQQPAVVERRAWSAMPANSLLVVLPEHPLLELLGDAADAVDLPVLGVEVRPRLVGAEEHAVAADARASRSRSAASARRTRPPTRCRCRPCSPARTHCRNFGTSLMWPDTPPPKCTR